MPHCSPSSEASKRATLYAFSRGEATAFGNLIDIVRRGGRNAAIGRFRNFFAESAQVADQETPVTWHRHFAQVLISCALLATRDFGVLGTVVSGSFQGCFSGGLEVE